MTAEGQSGLPQRGGGGSFRAKGKETIGREKRGGVWDPKVCIPEMAPSDFPNGKFIFSPRWSLWSWGGGCWHNASVYLIVCLWRRLLASRHCSF